MRPVIPLTPSLLLPLLLLLLLLPAPASSFPRVNISGDCSCSHHGACSDDGLCHCAPGHFGAYCELTTSLFTGYALCSTGSPLCYDCSLFHCPSVSTPLPPHSRWSTGLVTRALLPLPNHTFVQDNSELLKRWGERPFSATYRLGVEGFELLTAGRNVTAVCFDRIEECDCEARNPRLFCLYMQSQTQYGNAMIAVVATLVVAAAIDLILDGLRHFVASTRYPDLTRVYLDRVLSELAGMGMMGLIIACLGIFGRSEEAYLGVLDKKLCDYILWLESVIVLTFLMEALLLLCVSSLLMRRLERAEEMAVSLTGGASRPGGLVEVGTARFHDRSTFSKFLGSILFSRIRVLLFINVRRGWVVATGADPATARFAPVLERGIFEALTGIIKGDWLLWGCVLVSMCPLNEKWGRTLQITFPAVVTIMGVLVKTASRLSYIKAAEICSGVKAQRQPTTEEVLLGNDEGLSENVDLSPLFSKWWARPKVFVFFTRLVLFYSSSRFCILIAEWSVLRRSHKARIASEAIISVIIQAVTFALLIPTVGMVVALSKDPNLNKRKAKR